MASVTTEIAAKTSSNSRVIGVRHRVFRDVLREGVFGLASASDVRVFSARAVTSHLITRELIGSSEGVGRTETASTNVIS